MAYELRPGQGTAFKNKEKTEDWHAAYRGEVLLPNGEMHWLDIVPGKTKVGEWWFRIKVGGLKHQSPTAPNHAAAAVVSNDSDIPF